MNEEEKKAVGLLKALNNVEKKCKIEKVPYKSEIKKIRISLLPEDYGIFEILLNLIEKLQKENEELKEERQIVGIPVRNKRDRRIGIVLHQWESGSVAVLESINPRVINTHDSWNTLEIVTDEVKQTPPPEPQLPTKTICESFSKKVKNK